MTSDVNVGHEAKKGKKRGRSRSASPSRTRASGFSGSSKKSCNAARGYVSSIIDKARSDDVSSIIYMARGRDTASPSSSTPHNNNNNNSSPTIETPGNSSQQKPEIHTPNSNISTHVSHDSTGRNISMLEIGSVVSVHVELEDGDYVVRVKRRSITSSTDESNVEVTKQLAQSAGMLFLQADILRDMGEQLLAQYRASLSYAMGNTARRIDFT